MPLNVSDSRCVMFACVCAFVAAPFSAAAQSVAQAQHTLDKPGAALTDPLSRSRVAESADTVDVSLVVSGGVSLGAYQAGATFAFVHMLRHEDAMRRSMQQIKSRSSVIHSAEPPRHVLNVVTGASAGNVNALLAAFDYCAAGGDRDPEASDYWALWVGTGYDQLLVANAPTTTEGVLSRESLQSVVSRLKDKMTTDGGRRECDVVVGLTTTKLTPVTAKIVPGVEFPVQRHAGVFRVVVDGHGRRRLAQPRASDLADRALNGVIVIDPIEPDVVLPSWRDTA